MLTPNTNQFYMKNDKATETRTIVVGLIWNQKQELLLCKMPDNRGVFPNQWGLPGGGIDPGETMSEALRRELKEEIGINVDRFEPALFKDGTYEKHFPDGSKRNIYMIFLIFHCFIDEQQITLNEEFSTYQWVSESQIMDYEMNVETRDTIQKVGSWQSVFDRHDDK